VKLSKAAFSRAEEFIHSNARKLDVRLFEYHFKDGSKDEVLEELRKFQNPDGGFGHGIEPDFRLAGSSAMATSVGLQYCVDVDTKSNDEIISSVMNYLATTFDVENAFWPKTPVEVNDAPHAPWWHVDEIKPPAEASWANPNAELLGYLQIFQTHIPNGMLEILYKRALDNLNNLDTIESFLLFHELGTSVSVSY
jgi:hypothetical protein